VHVGLEFDQRREAFAQDGVIVDQQDPGAPQLLGNCAAGKGPARGGRGIGGY